MSPARATFVLVLHLSKHLALFDPVDCWAVDQFLIYKVVVTKVNANLLIIINTFDISLLPLTIFVFHSFELLFKSWIIVTI